MWNLSYSGTAILFTKSLASREPAALGTLISKKRNIGSWSHQSFINSRFLFLLLYFLLLLCFSSHKDVATALLPHGRLAFLIATLRSRGVSCKQRALVVTSSDWKLGLGCTQSAAPACPGSRARWGFGAPSKLKAVVWFTTTQQK